MKLFVDDIRKCPEGWVLARTVTEAIRIIDLMQPEEVSLDHDIQCSMKMGIPHSSNETFEPVARYIALLNEGLVFNNEIIKVRIHTSNSDGGNKMASILGISYRPYIYNEADYCEHERTMEGGCVHCGDPAI